jgi:ABC-2 type transport system ATP-binding protein
VPRGSFFGLVGPNGAGKTTSLSMVVGLLRPDGGTAAIFGVDVWTDPVDAKLLIGVLPEGLVLPDRAERPEPRPAGLFQLDPRLRARAALRASA